jgi:hypothetical protein
MHALVISHTIISDNVRCYCTLLSIKYEVWLCTISYIVSIFVGV